MRLLEWIGLGTDARGRTILGDLREDRPNLVLRGGLTFVMLGLSVAMAIFAMALFTVVTDDPYVQEETVAVCLAIFGAIWLGSLIPVWVGYRRFRRGVTTFLLIGVIWGTAIPACILIDAMVRGAGDLEEMLIAGTIVLGIAATFWVVLLALYRPSGRAVRKADGSVNVSCPQCGYSLVGLSDCACPECGAAWTLDELIGKQEFVRPAFAEEPDEVDDDEDSTADAEARPA